MKLSLNKLSPKTVGWTVLILSFVVLAGCWKKDFGGGKVEKTVGLDFPAPVQFLSHNVESEYSTSKAIPKVSAITKVAGGAVEIQSHPDYPDAQLRVIRLPKEIQSTDEVARILADSGAIQDCDILLSFRPEWYKFNGYCNIQLGISHTAIATIESAGGKKYVKTVESPLSYSSRLDYEHHYAALDLFHILRPKLSASQKKNVKAWSLKILGSDHDRITFFTDYGTPYKDRNLKAPASGNLPLDLAKTATYPEGNMSVSLYCSELVWAILALRDIAPSELSSQFPPGSGKDPTAWLTSKINPVFDPLPGITDAPLSNPGLMQGPDVQLRSIFGSDDAARRKFLLENVLLTKITNPAETEGHLSTGHAMAGNMFRATKLPGLRAFYATQNEASSAIAGLNRGIKSNYAPTSFFMLANLPSGTRKFDYVGTVSFRPQAEPVAAESTETPTPLE
ncbi:MAG: hypothetical protein P1V20_01450 [Verrucomicrobiales bacterium]|nr:hypothetical protein [Verrucomicrobiales bacterium]